MLKTITLPQAPGAVTQEHIDWVSQHIFPGETYLNFNPFYCLEQAWQTTHEAERMGVYLDMETVIENGQVKKRVTSYVIKNTPDKGPTKFGRCVSIGERIRPFDITACIMSAVINEMDREKQS